MHGEPSRCQDVAKLTTSLSYGFHGLAPLGEELIGSALPHLKLFTNSGAGTDIIDIPYFTSKNVYVANTPVRRSISGASLLNVADWATERRDKGNC